MRFFFGFVTLVTLVACTHFAERNRHDWIVEAGVRVGPITASSSAQDLRKAFGDAAVVDKEIDVGEEVTEPGHGRL